MIQIFNFVCLEKADVNKEAEMGMMLEDMERSQLSIMTLRKENQDLHTELNVLKTKSVVGDGQSLEKIRSLEEKCESVSRNYKRVTEDLEDVKKSYDLEIQNLNRLISDKDEKIQIYSTKLSEFEKCVQALPSKEEHENLKRKLHALQALQFNAVDSDLSTQTELEQLLMEKNKSLEAQLIKIKLDLTCAESKLDTLEADLNLAYQESEKQKTLIAKLEGDLERYSSKTDSSASTELITPSQDPIDQSRFDIIVGQRDRYRKRAELLENVSQIALKLFLKFV
jgi:chromosome segregation ATPase